MNKTREYKTPANKTWRVLRPDVTEARAEEIGAEMADALCDRLHNFKECVKHPFKKERREDMRTLRHHWE